MQLISAERQGKLYHFNADNITVVIEKNLPGLDGHDRLTQRKAAEVHTTDGNSLQFFDDEAEAILDQWTELVLAVR